MAIISVSGRINSGKDEIGKIIQYLTSESYKKGRDYETFKRKQSGNLDMESHYIPTFEIRKFADKLKDIVCMLIGCTRAQLEDREFKEKELGQEWEIPLKDYFKDIPGYEGLYQVSTFGKIKSLKRITPYGKSLEETIRVPHIGTSGYPSCTLNKNGKKKTISIHQLLAITFLDHVPDGYKFVVNHIDENKLNTRLDNIEIVSNRYNTQYSKKTNGVYERNNRFEVYIRIDGKKSYLGTYSTKEEALKVRNNKLKEIDDFVPKRYTKKYYSPRILLQEIGTNLFRDQVHPNTWVNSLMSEYKDEHDLSTWGHEAKYPNWVVTDMRFPNEMEAVKKRGGVTIRVNRNSVYKDSDTQFSHDIPHPSETALDNATFDYVIDNNGTIEELIEKVKEILVKENLL